MRTRRQPPSLVSMWMLDVFCCALGCVTLLWLLSTRDAKTEAAQSRVAVEQLAQTTSDLTTARSAIKTGETDRAALTVEADRLRALSDRVATQLATSDADRKALETRLTTQTATTATLQQQLDAALRTVTNTASQLENVSANSEALAAQLAAAQAEQDAIANRLATTSATQKTMTDQLGKVTADRDALAAKLAAAEQALIAGRAVADGAAKDLMATGDTLRQTRDELAATRATMIDLQGEKAKLADKLNTLQADTDARFAGIALTGRRVVFIVDMSGSMRLLDDRTPAPEKWSTVAETVGKVMRSLPELEQFQVVMFSRDARLLFPGAGWQEYRGEESVARVVAAVRAVKPDGDTNMYDAFDLAFRLRPSGLDTVYLFSDGLPTSGPGLTADQERGAAAVERSNRLAQHVLRTLRSTWNRTEPGRPRVRVNAIGFFFESPELGAFLWSLARDNDGSFVGMSRP